MDSIQKKLVAIVTFGFIQVIIINVLFWTNDITVEAMGSQVSVLGKKQLIITPPAGMVYVSHADSLKRYEFESLAFVLKGDSLHTKKPTLYADILIMDDIDSFEKLAELHNQEPGFEILFNRIQGSSLNIILLDGIPINDSAFTYIRFMKAYPYFLRIQCSYEGTMWPSDEILEILKAVKLI